MKNLKQKNITTSACTNQEDIQTLLARKASDGQRYGRFPTKPTDAKTLLQWLKEGRKPKNNSSYQYFQVKPGIGYPYICKTDTIELTEEEKMIVAQKYPPKDQTKSKQKETSTAKKAVFHNLKRIPESTNPKALICFDTETTGLSEDDELLQITIVNENEEVIYSSYFHPEHKTSWPEAEQVNHISPAFVQDKPYAKDCVADIQNIFDNAEVIVGHNVPFDIKFVERIGCKISPEKVVDTLNIFKTEYPEGKHKLQMAVETYAPEALTDYLQNAHDASADAIATIRVYLAMTKEQRKIRDLSIQCEKLTKMIENYESRISQLEQQVQEITHLDLHDIYDELSELSARTKDGRTID